MSVLSRQRFTPLDLDDNRVEVLFSLWGGRVSKAGIAQLLRDKVDIGKFTADRAARALVAIDAGKPMLERVNALLAERGEEDVNVTLMHRGFGIYRLVVLRGGRRGTSQLNDDMGLNAFVSAVVEATENLRAPLKGSFLGAAGGPTDVFDQGPLSAVEDDEA